MSIVTAAAMAKNSREGNGEEEQIQNTINSNNRNDNNNNTLIHRNILYPPFLSYRFFNTVFPIFNTIDM